MYIVLLYSHIVSAGKSVGISFAYDLRTEKLGGTKCLSNFLTCSHHLK